MLPFSFLAYFLKGGRERERERERERDRDRDRDRDRETERERRETEMQRDRRRGGEGGTELGGFDRSKYKMVSRVYDIVQLKYREGLRE